MSQPDTSREGWNVPQPEKLPRPTWWPAALSLGVTMLLWGIVTSPVVTIAGLVVFAVSLIGWIGEICHERKENE